jgi:hypothetical protein
MPGGRQTHEFPYGKPLRLVLLEIIAVFVGVAWLTFFAYGWWARSAVICAFLILAVLRSRLISGYVRDGSAVPIPRAVSVSYKARLPLALRLLRTSFFVSVAVMLVFGLAPLPRKIAEIGISVCVFSLFLGGFLHYFVERHFVNIGRAADVYPTTKR